MHSRLASLRDYLKTGGYDGMIIPRHDSYLNEYIAPSQERVLWLCGFTGSAGTIVVLPDRAVLFTDGRYLLQARQEIDTTQFDVVDSTSIRLIDWLKHNVKPDQRLAFDPRFHAHKDVQAWADAGLSTVALDQNPIDVLWHDRPAETPQPAFIYPLAIAGRSASEKISALRDDLKSQGCDGVFIARPDSVCWLLNIRGADVPHVPVVLCRALIFADGRIPIVFMAGQSLSDDVSAALGQAGVTCADHDAVLPALADLPRDFSLMIDEARTSNVFVRASKARIVMATDPCIAPRAIKTPAEQESIRAAHIHDGVAMVRLLRWVKQTPGITEHDVAMKSAELRAQVSPDFRDLSFPTIAGFGPNGAIIHYRPPVQGSASLASPGMVLIDSGAQYIGATTDITRTLCLGPPSVEQRAHYTQVLRAHIALSASRFPEGTRGVQIDAIARSVLWQAGLDYAHGTGHGVGCFLSVHEEAASLSPRGNDVLRAGMVLSNEPGLYLEGAYGIRIENLVLVSVAGNADTLGRPILFFETLTMVPYERDLIDLQALTMAEKEWLRAYYARIRSALLPHLTGPDRHWLEEQLAIAT